MKKFLYIFILLFIVGWAQAQQRVVYTINDGWKFTKGSPFEAQLAGCDDSSWETVCCSEVIRAVLSAISETVRFMVGMTRGAESSLSEQETVISSSTKINAIFIYKFFIIILY